MDEQKRWLHSFRRALKFLWPQRRRVLVAIICSMGLALSFAASLSVIAPILKLFMAEEGPRATVFQIAAEQALGVQLQPYRPDKHGVFDIDAPNTALVIKRLNDDSPLIHAGAKEGFLLYPADTDIPARLQFLEVIADTDESISMQLISPIDNLARTVTVRYPPQELKDRAILAALRRIGGLLPRDSTPQATRNALITVFVGVFVLVLLTNTCRFTAEYLVIIASNRAVMDMRRHMYHTIIHLPINWFSRHLSETMSRLVTDYKDVERGYRALFGKLTTEPIKVLILLSAAIYTDWRITLFALVAVPLGGLIVSALGRKIRRANHKLLAAFAQMIGVVNTTLSGIKIVRAYNNQAFERRRMWTADRRLLRQLLKIGRWEAMTGPLLEITGISVVMVGVIWMADYVFSGRLAPETFLALAIFMVAIFDSVRKISAVYPRLARAEGAAQRIFELINMPIEERLDGRFPPLPQLQQVIEFRNVTFTYPDSDQPALVEINLKIKKGQKVALVGPNGSGKTTCISLLERFYEPDSGQILLDGRNLAAHSIQSLREQISLVTQDAVIFAVSAYENIVYGLNNVSEEQVISAAKRAHAHEFIEQMPEGYQTVLGEFGATLSGGEKQRLALARAMLRGAPIFIFDEATSQIDVDSEKKIQEATRQFMHDRTSLVIAHRIATIIDADQIAVFDQGRLLDVGDHQSLLKRCALYKTLYQTHTHSI